MGLRAAALDATITLRLADALAAVIVAATPQQRAAQEAAAQRVLADYRAGRALMFGVHKELLERNDNRQVKLLQWELGERKRNEQRAA